MMSFFSSFWSESFWLPPNSTWNDVAPYNRFEMRYNVYYPIFMAIGLYFIRVLFEQFIAKPIGVSFGLKKNSSMEKFLPNFQLEVYYKQNNKPTESIYMHIARDVNKNVDEVKKWFAARRSLGQPSKLDKFSEASWRFVFYLFIWIYGLNMMYTKSWMWDRSEFWRNYPRHSVGNDIYWYYTLELGFYLSLFVTQFFDVKRKDFWEMFVHHVVSISLIFFTYTCNYVRVLTYVVFLHDCVDFWLELAKLGIYVKAQRFSDVIFIIFTLVWFITRILVYPFWVLYSTTFEGHIAVSNGVKFPVYWLINGLMFCLQILHIIWFYMICRMAYRSIVKGAVVKDDRSESDEDETKSTKNE